MMKICERAVKGQFEVENNKRALWGRGRSIFHNDSRAVDDMSEVDVSYHILCVWSHAQRSVPTRLLSACLTSTLGLAVLPTQRSCRA
jgi:hypothetical protein